MKRPIPILIAVFAFILACACTVHKEGKENSMNQFVDSLINVMTLEEKVGQLTLYTSGWEITGPTLNEDYLQELKDGKVGGLFNAHTVAYNKELQEIAVNETRLGIPLIFGYDVIHGHRTTFPTPLAESCTWDLAMIEETARLSAMEAAASGLNWTFNPMVDIARDPRWGRIAEGAGEDTYWGSLVGAAKVRGYQGKELSDPLTIAACVKHFAAYGGAQAGRDYHTVDISERTLRSDFLPPFKAAIDAGAATVMTAFNEIDGLPATGSRFLLKEILRDEFEFKGMVVTDYTSINEMVPHGVAADLKEAAELAIQAGVDMDMQGGAFSAHLDELVQDGSVSEQTIDMAVRNILFLKWKLGLFEDPYLYLDEKREKEIVYSKELLDHALEVALSSIVLLKNSEFKGRKLLPLPDDVKRVAVIGPLADNQIDMLGSWHASGDPGRVSTLIQALRNRFVDIEFVYTKGTGFEQDDESDFENAISLAKSADLVILALGENHTQSGEAASRTHIGLPGSQLKLAKSILNTGKPIVALVTAGRPLTISWLDENIPAIVNTWQLGNTAGDAITAVLSGDFNPSGKLTTTFPRNVGQVPIHYNMKNTGRPFDGLNKYTSKYLDSPNTPLYPFGYGLSYSNFEYSNMELSNSEISMDQELKVSVMVKNKGEVSGHEVVQMYIRDVTGSVTRPVKELKGYQKILITPGETQEVKFHISAKDLAFYTGEMIFKAEPGKFEVFVGTNSNETLTGDFWLIE